MAKQNFEIGIVGLGVMGRNLALNVADHGFSVVGYDLDAAKVKSLRAEAGDRPVAVAEQPGEVLRPSPQPPRAVIMLVPAGAPSIRSCGSESRLSSPAT